MKTSSAKAKGRKLQNHVKCALLGKEVWKDLGSTRIGKLTEDDVRCALMGECGVDIKLSARGRSYFPFAVECKNTETASVWQWIAQAEANSIDETIPLVVFSRNRSKVYCVIEFDKLMELV